MYSISQVSRNGGGRAEDLRASRAGQAREGREEGT